MKIQELLENNVVDAVERFRSRVHDSKTDKRSTGYEDAVMADISAIIQPRWSKRFFNEQIDTNSYHKEDDYLTRIYYNLPYDDEELSPENRIAYTIFINNKDMIFDMLNKQREELVALKKKYNGIFIYTNLIDDYITTTDLLDQGFHKYIKTVND